MSSLFRKRYFINKSTLTCQAGKGSWSFLLDLTCNFYYARNLYVRNHGTLPCDNLLTQQSLKGEGNTCQNYSHLMAEKA